MWRTSTLVRTVVGVLTETLYSTYWDHTILFPDLTVPKLYCIKTITLPRLYHSVLGPYCTSTVLKPYCTQTVLYQDCTIPYCFETILYQDRTIPRPHHPKTMSKLYHTKTIPYCDCIKALQDSTTSRPYQDCTILDRNWSVPKPSFTTLCWDHSFCQQG